MASTTLTSSIARHPFRTGFRLVWLLGVMAWSILDYLVRVRFKAEELKPRLRGEWLQRSCRGVLSVLNVDIRVQGEVPERGLLVSNHLGYLDVFTLATVTPAAFIAKAEVRAWPVMGWYARMAGTVFVRREKRSEVVKTTEMIRDMLGSERLIVLFAEGTSTGGDRVLPFKSSLIAPAVRLRHPITAGCLGYRLMANDGDVSQEVCFWTDAAFPPHLLNLMSKKGVVATVSFEPAEAGDLDRKELAGRLHTTVVSLKEKQDAPA